NPPAALEPGAVYLFDGGTGALVHTFVNPDPVLFDRFGYSASVFTVSGTEGPSTRLVVGAMAAPGGGRAFVFDADRSSPGFGSLLLTLGENAGNSGVIPVAFGSTVLASGEDFLVADGGLAVPTPDGPFGTAITGGVYLLDGTTGAFLQTLSDPDPQLFHGFWSAMDVVGGSTLIGAPTASLDIGVAPGPGGAYLMDTASGDLQQAFPPPASSPAPPIFGQAVATSGDALLVGAPQDNTAGVG